MSRWERDVSTKIEVGANHISTRPQTILRVMSHKKLIVTLARQDVMTTAPTYEAGESVTEKYSVAPQTINASLGTRDLTRRPVPSAAKTT